MEATVDPDHLAEETRIWTAIRLAFFPVWQFEDIWCEAYVQAHGIIRLWDQDRGPLNLFLRIRLFECVWPSYLRDQGRRPIRKQTNGKWSRRTSVLLAESLGWRDIPYTPRPKPEMPKGLKPDEQRTFNHMMRGLNQQQVAYAEGISESAISQRLKRMRSRLYD
tara:strand:- start:317 stop:808 length:492 start_codon:yes stop_codon:yes gene_type:complete